MYSKIPFILYYLNHLIIRFITYTIEVPFTFFIIIYIKFTILFKIFHFLINNFKSITKFKYIYFHTINIFLHTFI